MNATSAKSSAVPAILLTVLLLLLAFRLTCTETLRETMTQKAVRLEAEAHPTPDKTIAPFIGPAWTAGYAAVAFLVAGAAACVATLRGAMSRVRLGQFLLIAAILAALAASTFHAADRFSALIGTADLATSLLCAWAVALLCDEALLGVRGRNAAITAIVAILAICAAKAWMQHFIEYPDLREYVMGHLDDAMQQAGISNDPAQVKLFLGRLNSAEVSSFGALSNVFATELIALAALCAAVIAAMIPVIKNSMQSRPKATGTKHTKVLMVIAAVPLTAMATLLVLGFAMKNADLIHDGLFVGGLSIYIVPFLPILARCFGDAREISMRAIAFVAALILLPAAVLALLWTQSKGGGAAAILACAAIGTGAVLRAHVARWHRPLLGAFVAVLALASAGVVLYGRAHHGLPTKSLLFRWQYWSATVPMVEQSPALGVGLNNFGDCYLQFKSPAFPEDVKDPHNFFVRLAAETGIPATVLVSCLMLCLIARAFRGGVTPGRAVPTPDSKNRKSTIENRRPSAVILAAVAAIFWIPLHLVSEGDDAFTTRMTIIYAVVGWALFATTWTLLEAIAAAPDRPAGIPLPPRFIALGGIIAALCMLLYDQVNMALVTGPAAMLFWLLLSLGDAGAGRVRDSAARTKIIGLVVGAACLVAGLVVAALLMIPITNDSFALDPEPFEYEYLRDITPETRNDAGALQAIDRAITLAPNSGELIMRRITLKRDRLHVPVADDLRRMLLLDRANARVRLDLALPDTDLPAAERVAALQDALRFDQALAAFGRTFASPEPKQLTDEQIKAAEEAIARLSAH